jgi:hypothetical protein
MKKKLILVTVAVTSILVYSCTKENQTPTSNRSASISTTSGNLTGSGAPSGAHYDLNLIGVPKGKTADMTGDNGHRIFLPLYGTAKINLSEGDFQVLDANGTDGVAAFQLPNPDATNSGTTTYSVYARSLGTPGGSSVMKTCATDGTGATFCSGDTLLSVRTSGKSLFTNVSKELLYIYVDIDGDGVVDRVPLFDSKLQGYYWQYDNTGLKLLQLRFYQNPTTVP